MASTHRTEKVQKMPCGELIRIRPVIVPALHDPGLAQSVLFSEHEVEYVLLGVGIDERDNLC